MPSHTFSKLAGIRVISIRQIRIARPFLHWTSTCTCPHRRAGIPRPRLHFAMQIYHCLQMLALGCGSTTSSPPTCLLQRCGALHSNGGVLAAMLHTAETHALHVINLSAGAAGAAEPGKTYICGLLLVRVCMCMCVCTRKKSTCVCPCRICSGYQTLQLLQARSVPSFTSALHTYDDLHDAGYLPVCLCSVVSLQLSAVLCRSKIYRPNPHKIMSFLL